MLSESESSLTTNDLARVMIIDDCPTTTESISMILSDEEFRCSTCNDPRQAVEVALEFAPTVLLLDLRMPHIDGFQLLHLLRKHNTLRDVPVVVLSAEESPGEKAIAFAFGVTDYLVKTPDPIELCARVRYHSRAYLERSAHLKDKNQKLEAALVKLERADQAKTAFLANMSHEIRTPMNGILGLASLLQSTELSEEQKGFVEQIMTSGTALLDIINDILDTSKIESGMLEIECLPFNPRELSAKVVGSIAPSAQAKGIALDLELADDIPGGILGDPGRLRQVLLNLLSNAVKFTSEGGVTLTLSLQEQRIHYRVTDTGIGIPESKLEAVFQPFKQAEASTAREYGGTGLGLPISASLAKLMGGELQIQSELGKGTEFFFSLPYEIAALPTTDSVAVAGPDRHLRVLLAEDNPINQTVSCGFLDMLGHEVMVANDGAEAVTLNQENEFDVILMDLQMPNLDGFSALKKIRCADRHSNLPVIALTAHAMKGDRERCLAAGMTGYLSKPFQLHELREALEEVFAVSLS